MKSETGLSQENGKWVARLRVNGQDVEKAFDRKTDARTWREDIRRDLKRMPDGITYKVRSGWTAVVEYQGVEMPKIFTDLDAALAWKAKTEFSISTGTYIPGHLANKTFQEFAEEWMSGRSSVKDTSLLRDWGLLRNHLFIAFGSKNILSVQRAAVIKWVSDEQKAGKSPQTIDKALGLLNQIFREGIAQQLIQVNPAIGVKSPKIQKADQRSFTFEEIKSIAKSCGKYFYVVEFLAATGLRPAEFAALKVSSFNTVTKELSVENNFSIDSKYKRVLSSTKTNQIRRIPLPGVIADRLMQQVKGRNKSEWLFPGKRGGAMDMNYFRKNYFSPALLKLGIKGANIYTLRHSFGSNLLANGKDIITVSKLMGHSTPQQTLNTYAHEMPGNRADAMTVMEGIFQEETGQSRGSEEITTPTPTRHRANNRPRPLITRDAARRPRRDRTDDPRIKRTWDEGNSEPEAKQEPDDQEGQA